MNAVGPASECLKFVPGEILVVRWRSLKDEPTGSRFGLGEVQESVSLEPPESGSSPERRRVLERITVPIGLELRYLQIVARQQDVFAESLNYLCTSASTTTSNQSSTQAPTWFIVASDGTASPTAAMPLFAQNVPLLVALETGEVHCKNVLRAAQAAARVYGVAHRVMLCGLCEPMRANIFGIYQYLAMAAKLIDLPKCPDAIVMSVDFGITCLDQSAVGGVSPLEGQGSLGCYSFPIFEAALSVILETCSRKPPSTKVLPAIFAAAGNRDTNFGIRQRLAYPALCPDIFAVTHVSPQAQQPVFAPSKTSDLTLSHDMKPIFGVEEAFAAESGAPTDGTSFAAPWCAAWYLSMKYPGTPNRIAQEMAKPLARIATLQQFCTPTNSVGRIGQADRSTPMELLPRKTGVSRSTPPNGGQAVKAAADLIRVLNEEFADWEFAVTGSAAMILAAVSGCGYLEYLCPSDIDIVFNGEKPMSVEKFLEIKTKASAAFSAIFKMTGMRVELTTVSGRVAPFALFQCIIPAAAMYITAAGILDAWHGQKDIQDGRVRVLEPSPELNIRNPLAIAEQHARLPSLLVALSATCRLQEAYLLSHSSSVFPDLSEPWEERLQRVWKQDSVATWTWRIYERLEKLSNRVERVVELFEGHRKAKKAPNICGALRALRTVAEPERELLNRRDSNIMFFADRFVRYETRFD